MHEGQCEKNNFQISKKLSQIIFCSNNEQTCVVKPKNKFTLRDYNTILTLDSHITTHSSPSCLCPFVFLAGHNLYVRGVYSPTLLQRTIHRGWLWGGAGPRG